MSSSVVEAPDLSGLIELARDPHLDLKPVVLRVQTDLFLAAPIRDRAVLEAFRLLATGLIPTVDEETAVIVARKLAPCHDTPEDVLLSLAGRGGAVCEALLDQATYLPLAVIAAMRGAGLTVDAERYARRPETVSASRTEEPDHAMTTPTETDDRDDVIDDTLDDARARGPSLRDLIGSARTNPDKACTLLARDDLADADLAPLWLHADRQQRAAIREAVEATAALRPCPPAPRDLAAALSAFSDQSDIGRFVAALTQGVGLPEGFLGAAPDASSRYDLLALALRAADLRDCEAIHIFLTLNETVARSVSRVFELAALYRTTSRAAARDLLCAILDTTLPERVATGEHRAYLAPDAARPRASAAAERALPRAIPTLRTQRNG